MKDFERRQGRLRALSLHARLAYSVFLAFTLVGLGLSLWLAHDMVSLDLGGLDEYYAGIPSEPTLQETPSGGPELMLPDEALAPPTAEPLSTRKLLEVTHFHLFSMPVYLLILSHIFMLSQAGRRSKTIWIAVATIAVALHMVAPWVAAAASPASGFLYASSGLGLLVSFGWMCLVPLWEMWRPAGVSQS